MFYVYFGVSNGTNFYIYVPHKNPLL